MSSSIPEIEHPVNILITPSQTARRTPEIDEVGSKIVNI